MKKNSFYLNAHAEKIARVKISEIVSHIQIAPSDREVLIGQLPLLKNPTVLKPLAIDLLVLESPPVLVCVNKKPRTYAVVGNLRTVEICHRVLPADTQLSCIVVNDAADGLGVTQLQRLNLSALIASFLFGLDAAAANSSIHELTQQIPPDQIRAVCPQLATKIGREQLLGLNRRYSPPRRHFAQSPTAQIHLFERADDSDDEHV